MSVPQLRRQNEDVHLNVLDGLPADHEAAIGVWRAANIARLLPPSVERVARIWEKLADPGACLVIGHPSASRDVLAMALAEPGRAQDGAGAVIPGGGHVSMVFVHPDMWGRGVGRQLLQGLHGHVGTGCRPPAAAGTTRACIGKGMEPYDAVDPGVERARSTPVPKPGIPSVRPRDHTWRRWPHPPARASSTLTRDVR